MNPDLLPLGERYWPEDTKSMSENSYQSHLAQVDVKFKEMNVILPEQSFDDLMRMGVVSV
jgi:hypothetical protein